MTTAYHHLSDYDPDTVPDASGMRFAIIVSEWNGQITSQLEEGAYNTLLKFGVKQEDIARVCVPGSFELIYAASRVAKSIQLDAVIGLGCVIRGETPHFEYVCSGVAQGFAKLNAEGNLPYIFGLLTCDTLQQAIDRSGGILGNKGIEAAITAIKMAKIACLFK
jgi:6,7-dimethyl-8-ribityllumazine synthase